MIFSYYIKIHQIVKYYDYIKIHQIVKYYDFSIRLLTKLYITKFLGIILLTSFILLKFLIIIFLISYWNDIIKIYIYI